MEEKEPAVEDEHDDEVESIGEDSSDDDLIQSSSEIKFIGYYNGDDPIECLEELQKQIRSGKVPKELFWVEYERKGRKVQSPWTALAIDNRRRFIKSYITKLKKKKATKKKVAEHHACDTLLEPEFWPNDPDKAKEIARKIHAALADGKHFG